MSDFKLNSITMQGAVVIASLVAGGKLEFTRIQVGDGNIPDGQTPMTMTGLAHPLFDVTIHEVDFDSEAQATIKGIFSNDQVDTGFFYRELGLFAIDPTTKKEILFCYGNAADAAEWINAAGEGSIIEKEVHIVTLVGNATSVSAELESGIYETKERVAKMMALKADLDATSEEGGRVVASQMRFDDSQTLYVDAAAAEGGDGSEAKPFKTIQAAIDARYMGAPVIFIKIKPGTYSEDIKTPRAPDTTWRISREGDGIVSIQTAIFDNAGYLFCDGLTFGGPVKDNSTAVYVANCPSVYLRGVTVNGSTSATGINFANCRGMLQSVKVNGCGLAIAATDGSFIFSRETSGTGNVRGLQADGSTIICDWYVPSATTQYERLRGGIISVQGGTSTAPSNWAQRLSLGDFSTAAALKAAILAEFKKLGVGETRACWFANNVSGGFGIFGTGQRMACDITKTTDYNGGYGVVFFHNHNDPASGYMQIVDGAFKTAEPVSITKWQVINDGKTNVLELPTGIYSLINVTSAQNLPGTQSGTLIVDKNVGSKHLTFFVDIEPKIYSRTQYTTGAWSDWVQYAPIATTSEYGLVKLADETAVLSENVEAAVHVPMMYEINDFRRKSKAYAVGDRVACAFLYDLFLECTKAGTTSSNTLDTRTVKHGQVITDGTAQWTVRTHVRSVAGAVAGADGNVVLPLDYLPLKGGTVSGNLAVTGNATVGGKNVVRTVNGVTANSAGNVVVRDVYVDGDTSDSASERGQIGDAKRLESADLNTIITPGIYRNTGNPTNQPSDFGLSGVGVLVVSGQSGSGNRLFQTLTTTNGIAWRTSTTNGETWDDWQLVLTSNKVGKGLALSKGTLLVNDVAISGNPSDLASSRGQIGNCQSIENPDFNDLTDSGTWRIGGTRQQNSPGGANLTGLLCVVANEAKDYVFQTFMRTYLSDTMYVRTKHGTDAWQPWRRVMLDVQAEDFVHKTGVETIAGKKTFTDTAYFDGDVARRIGGTSGRIAIQNTNLVKGTKPTATTWFDLPCTDSQGTNTENRAGVLSVAVYTDGATRTYMRAYKWESGSTATADIYVGFTKDGTAFTYAPTPPAADNSTQIATTNWVLSRIGESAQEETRICSLDEIVTFSQSGSRICGTVLLQVYKSIDGWGTWSDDFGVYIGSTKIATVTLTQGNLRSGGSGYGRSVEQTMIGNFEVTRAIPAGSKIKLIRESSNIGGTTRACFAHVTISK